MNNIIRTALSLTIGAMLLFSYGCVDTSQFGRTTADVEAAETEVVEAAETEVVEAAETEVVEAAETEVVEAAE